MMRLLVTTVVSAASTMAPAPGDSGGDGLRLLARNTDDVVGRSLGRQGTLVDVRGPDFELKAGALQELRPPR